MALASASLRRSLSNVIFGGYGTKNTGTGKAMAITGTHTEATVDDVVQLLADARKVIITPGYVGLRHPSGAPLSMGYRHTLFLLLTTLPRLGYHSYGLAVARAQYSVAEMTKKLRAAGKDVSFAIHPVAGRLPGQVCNVAHEARHDQLCPTPLPWAIGIQCNGPLPYYHFRLEYDKSTRVFDCSLTYY